MHAHLGQEAQQTSRWRDRVTGVGDDLAPLLQDKDDSAQQKKGFKGGGTKKGFGGDYRNFSPDKALYAYVKNHNLYVAESGKEDQAKQLTKDGNEDYTFSAGIGFGGQQFQKKKDDKGKGADDEQEKSGDTKKESEKKTRADVRWSKDSKAFYVMRRDARGIKDLYLVNSVAEPRPTLMKYPYPMPGEDNIRKNELYVITHGEWRLMAEARHTAIIAAMPEKLDPLLVAMLQGRPR